MDSNPIAVTCKSWWKSIHHIKLITKLLYRSSRSQMFFRISVLTNIAIFTENTFFNKVAGLKECNFIKKRLINTGVFLWILRDFKEQQFLQNTSGGCFCTSGTTVLENIAKRNGKKHSHDEFSYNYLGSYNYLTYYYFKEKCLKNWHVDTPSWKIGTPFGTLAR